jgi:oligopeptide/dipeptide ABC transporter ATP-binding protein
MSLDRPTTDSRAAAAERPGGRPAGRPLLEAEGLVVNYPVRRGLVGALRREPHQHVRAVDGVSLTVAKGELLALVGESGCGKTTTARAVLRLLEPASGTLHFGGEDITHLPAKELRQLRRRMQLIYQDPYESLDPRFRVRATMEEPLAIHGIGSRAERRQRTRDALERAGLAPADLYLDRYPHELSGGQRQRVAIAAGLVLDPELLVADEPASMLDVSVRAGVLALLTRLRREADLGILMITHDFSTAAHFADRIAVMYLGRIVEEGPARRVVNAPAHPYTRALLSAVPPRNPRERRTPQILKGEPPDPAAVPPGCRFHPRCPLAVEECPTIDPALRPVPSSGPDGGRHRAACILV